MELSSPPREWAERFFNVDRWTEMPRGGHFAAMEVPELLAHDLYSTFILSIRRYATRASHLWPIQTISEGIHVKEGNSASVRKNILENL